MFRWLAASLVALVLAATAREAGAQPAETAATPRATAPGLMLPGTFVGVLPSASGPGIRTQLDLWPDQVFQLRRAWVGATEDLLGRWHVDPDRRALVLDGGETPAPQFEILGNGTLRLLDRQGGRIQSTLPYALARADAFTPFEARVVMRGVFLYFADAARFTECRSGRAWPVAMEGAFLDLQRAYLAARPAPEVGVMVSLEAMIAARPRMEGEGTQPTLVVERFVLPAPGEACERPVPAATLRNTYWRFLTLGGEALEVAEGRREPYLLLSATELRFAATIGCNQLIGGVETAGTSLRFLSGPSTMMACPPPLDAHEQALAAMLRDTASYRIEGTTLALLATDRTPLATLEAVYLP